MRGRRGSALIELTLLAPWVLFLFVGTFDLGFYYYSLIAVENAARIAAAYTSQSPSFASKQDGACTRVLAELSSLPNISSIVNSSTCTAAPLIVTASPVTGADGWAATSVSVTYRGLSMIPIPGLLMGQFNVTRTVQMRVQP
jgi:Flp pilus assembly protein TadG